jgi:hypothetical protein
MSGAHGTRFLRNHECVSLSHGYRDFHKIKWHVAGETTNTRWSLDKPSGIDRALHELRDNRKPRTGFQIRLSKTAQKS